MINKTNAMGAPIDADSTYWVRGKAQDHRH